MTANMASTASHPQNTNLFARCRQAKSPRPARNIIARIIVMMFSGSSTPVSSRQRSLTVNRLLKVRGFAVSQRLISSNRTSAFQSVTSRYVPNLNVRCRFRKWCVLCLARRCRNEEPSPAFRLMGPSESHVSISRQLSPATTEVVVLYPW